MDPIYDYCDNTRGVRFAYPTSVEETARVIAEFSPECARAFLKFAEDYAPTISELVDNFFSAPSLGFMDIFRLIARDPGMLAALPMFVTTQQKVVARYFRHQDVLASMAFQSFSAGLPSDMCAGLYAVSGLLEHQGIFYPEGGMIRLPAGIQRASMIWEGKLRPGLGWCGWWRTAAPGACDRPVGRRSPPTLWPPTSGQKLFLEMNGEEHLPWLAQYGIRSHEVSMSCVMLHVEVEYRPSWRGTTA